MWKCSICGAINSNREKFCMFCGAESVVKEKKIIIAALKFLSVNPDVNIYISSTEMALTAKNKIRFAKIMDLITKIGFAAILLIILLFGTFTVILSKDSNGLELQTKLEAVKNNIAENPKEKWNKISIGYDNIKYDLKINTEYILSRFDESWRKKVDNYKSGGLKTDGSWQIKSEYYGGNAASFGESWQNKTENYNKNLTDFSGTLEKKADFFPRLWGYIAAVPDKCSYYYDKITKTISKIIGG